LAEADDANGGGAWADPLGEKADDTIADATKAVDSLFDSGDGGDPLDRASPMMLFFNVLRALESSPLTSIPPRAPPPLPLSLVLPTGT
jgi:hypothetical protein